MIEIKLLVHRLRTLKRFILRFLGVRLVVWNATKAYLEKLALLLIMRVPGSSRLMAYLIARYAWFLECWKREQRRRYAQYVDDNYGDPKTIKSDGRLALSKDIFQANEICGHNRVRGEFGSCEFTLGNPLLNHSHGAAALERNAVGHFVNRVALACGLRPYAYEMATRDVARKYAGRRGYFWSKDMMVPPVADEILPTDLVFMVDVDFYVDMNAHLVQHRVSHILYTIAPETCAGDVNGTSFRFIDDQLEMHISGGQTYRHKLWNYAQDNITVSGWVGTEFISATYLVEKRMVSAIRCLVLLTPIAVHRGKHAELSLTLDHNELTVYSPLTPSGYNVIQSVGTNGSFVSLAPNGAWRSVTITAEQEASLQVAGRLAANQKIPLQAATTESWLPPSDHRKADAAMLTEYYRKETGVVGTYVFPVHYAVAEYQFKSYNQDVKPRLMPFMSPVLGSALTPSSTLDNDEITVNKRILEVASRATTTKYVAEAIRDFIGELIPDSVANTLAPFGVEEVFERMPRPTQQAGLFRAGILGPGFKTAVGCFQKKDVYPVVSPPRNISVINPTDKLKYSQFMYAFSDMIVKPSPWYAFGRTPRAISERIGAILEPCESTFLGDFSKMDGRVSSVGRLLTTACFARAFHFAYHADMFKGLESQYGCRGFTTHGVSFDSGYSRASGSPETSCFNSLENAFTCYLAYRSQRTPGGAYRDHAEAWELLNSKVLCGGDDSVVGDVTAKEYTDAAARMGHVATGELVLRGSRINFLSRQYSPNAWYGDLSSCMDIRRCLNKFHTAATFPKGSDPVLKFVEKVQSVMSSDSNTPLIRAWVNRVLTLYRGNPVTANGDGYYWSAEEGDNYPNENAGGWMDAFFVEQLPEYPLGHAEEWIMSQTTLAPLLKMPMFNLHVTVHDIPAGVVVAGESGQGEEKAAEPIEYPTPILGSVMKVNKSIIRDGAIRLARRQTPVRVVDDAKPEEPKQDAPKRVRADHAKPQGHPPATQTPAKDKASSVPKQVTRVAVAAPKAPSNPVKRGGAVVTRAALPKRQPPSKMRRREERASKAVKIPLVDVTVCAAE